MVDPLSVVGTILTVVQMIGSAASTASQNKFKCLELAERAQTLAHVLPSLAHAAAANDAATARVLERLRDAVSEALRLIESCQAGGIFSGKYSSGKATELDSVDKRINNCIMDLNLIGQARSGHAATSWGKVTAPEQTGEHVDHSSSYYQAQGSSAYVGWVTPLPPQQQQQQHAWGTSPPPPQQQHVWGTSQGYYQQPPGYGQWVPGTPVPYYPTSPAPSGSNLSSLYTLPTVNKMFNSMFR